MLPKHCGQMMIGFLLLALLMSLMRDLVPTRFSVLIPVPMAMAIPFYVGAHVAVSAFIGALVKAYWYWTADEAAPTKVRLLMWQHPFPYSSNCFCWVMQLLPCLLMLQVTGRHKLADLQRVQASVHIPCCAAGACSSIWADSR